MEFWEAGGDGRVAHPANPSWERVMSAVWVVRKGPRMAGLESVLLVSYL